jgi:hypothetical protein
LRVLEQLLEPMRVTARAAGEVVLRAGAAIDVQAAV